MEPKPHWLNKKNLAASLGITVQALDKWKVEPVDRIGRENFYDVRSVLDNRLALAEQQSESADGTDGVDPLIEYKLLQEKLRLTKAMAVTQETKNQVAEKLLVPVPFATFALAKVAAQIGSKLETVGKTVSRRHPEIDPRILETIEREIAQARNVAAQFGDDLPETLDEYLSTLA